MCAAASAGHNPVTPTCLHMAFLTACVQDSDERACAYIAGPAPNRWGNFTPQQQQGRSVPSAAVVPPLQLSASPAPEEVQRAAAIRRAHPLYASITLGRLGFMGWVGAQQGVCNGCGCKEGGPWSAWRILGMN